MVPQHRRSMGIVFQDFSLLPKKTVFENVAFAMEIIQRSRRTINRQVPQILELVGIKDEANKLPNEISIGEQQRVAIARAIINNPDLLIADEPTGNLDPETGWDIMRLLEQISRRGTTVLMVTHSREIVNAMNKRVVAIRSGRIVRDERGGFYHPDEDDDPVARALYEGAIPL
jgi:cell division transport system ATP-binding protein